MSALLIQGRASALPLSLIAQAIPRLSRCDLEALTERLIDHLDDLDGDPDAEDDDPAGQCDEDCLNTGLPMMFIATRSHEGAGCPISDPGEWASGEQRDEDCWNTGGVA